MKAGLVSISLRQLSPRKIVDLVSECGLSGIEWGGDVHVPHGNTAIAREVAHMTRDAGLMVASYGSYYRFAECDVDAKEGGPSMMEIVETAEALGAPAIRVWAGQRGPDQTSEAVWDAIVRRTVELADEAFKRGMRIDFEFHENTLTETAASTCRLLEEIIHPTVRTLWQPPLLTSPSDRLAGLRGVKKWISNIHCNHFDQNPWPDILELHEGTEEWSKYLDELKELSPDRWIMIEHVKDHSADQIRKDASALLNWLKAEDE